MELGMPVDKVHRVQLRADCMPQEPPTERPEAWCQRLLPLVRVPPSSATLAS